MPIEQEPLKIEIPVEEEETVLRPERTRPDVSQHLRDAGQEVTERAREAWSSETRQQAEAAARRGLRQGAGASRVGLVHGLRWVSRQLASLADRFTPTEKPPSG